MKDIIIKYHDRFEEPLSNIQKIVDTDGVGVIKPTVHALINKIKEQEKKINNLELRLSYFIND